jgi:DNA gyrase subunit B
MSGAIFSSQTKDKLTSDVAKQVEDSSYPVILKFFTENPLVAKNVINRAKTVASSREQFKTVLKNLSSMKKSGGLFLPDVLTSCPDCDPSLREVFIVEGISASGNAKIARNSEYQEVLSLSGKVANAHRLPLSRLVSSEPIQNLMIALGASFDGITKEESVLTSDDLRVKRVYVMADSDPDGCHISVLVLTVLWRFIPSLFKAGRVWVTNIPLYHAMHKKSFYFGDTFDDVYQKLPASTPKNIIVRAKGLAECSVEILEYAAFDPATRFVIKIAPPEDKDSLSYFERLVGSDSAERKKLLGL